jgi:hypothetical protein
MDLMKVANRVSVRIVFLWISFMPIGIADKKSQCFATWDDFFFLYYLTIQTLSIKKTKGLSLSNQNFDQVVSEYAIVHLHYSKTFFPIEAWTYLYIMAAAYILDFGINYGGQPPINLNGGSPIFIFF